MREASGTTTMFKLILAFTFLFSGFLAVAITYNRAFKLKNETISILEKYEGPTEKALEIVNNYLKNSGYRETGKCSEGEYGITSLDSTVLSLDSSNNYYCLSCTTTNCAPVDGFVFYNFKIFFKFNLPIIGNLSEFKITGQTKPIKYYSDIQKLKVVE